MDKVHVVPAQMFRTWRMCSPRSRLVSLESRGNANLRWNPCVLSGGVTATVEITMSEKVVIEESSKCKALGQFILPQGSDTIAVCLIDKVLD
jgi:translation elongation factor EF-1alpha